MLLCAVYICELLQCACNVVNVLLDVSDNLDQNEGLEHCTAQTIRPSATWLV